MRGIRQDATPKLVEIGRRIAEARRAKALSQEALAWQVGIHTNHLSTIERGVANPSFAVLLAISESLAVPLAELVRDLEDA